jgi:hypothetical protein
MRGLGVAMISFFNIVLGLGGGTTLTAFLTDYVYADPLKVGLSISSVSVPAGLLAAFLPWRASVAADRMRAGAPG